ncbi:MAG: Uma2 family endonuclease [Saprospiraceae bacterium]
MVSPAIQEPTAARPSLRVRPDVHGSDGNGAVPKKISWEAFERRYLRREDKYKYEWVDGTVVKTPRTMNQRQQFILINLQAFLDKLRTHKNLGLLLAEVDTFFGPNHRRPDIAYFSPEQVSLLRHAEQVPQFVVEIISSKDQLNEANEKLADYRRANVQIVWHVFPKLNEVHVYRGKKMEICLDTDPCSAEPVIPGFVMSAKEVFM